MPTEIEVDATAALAGPLRDRVSRASRYLAARLAMVRQSIQDGEINPIKVPGEGHRADGFTKPLVGAAFRTFAAANLGMAVGDLAPPGRVRAPPGALHNGGYGGSYASRSGNTDGGSRDPQEQGAQRTAEQEHAGGMTGGKGRKGAQRNNDRRASTGTPGKGTGGKGGKGPQQRGERSATGRGDRAAGEHEERAERRGSQGRRRQPNAAAVTTGSNRANANGSSNGTARV